MKGGIKMNNRIKNIRKYFGYSQQNFADILGISRGNIAAYEVGKNAPSDAVISLICTKFNINENWLRTGTENMFKELTRNQEIQAFANEVMELPDKDIKKKMILAISKLSAQDWEILIKCAENLMNEIKEDG